MALDTSGATSSVSLDHSSSQLLPGCRQPSCYHTVHPPPTNQSPPRHSSPLLASPRRVQHSHLPPTASSRPPYERCATTRVPRSSAGQADQATRGQTPTRPRRRIHGRTPSSLRGSGSPCAPSRSSASCSSRSDAPRASSCTSARKTSASSLLTSLPSLHLAGSRSSAPTQPPPETALLVAASRNPPLCAGPRSQLAPLQAPRPPCPSLTGRPLRLLVRPLGPRR